MSPTQEPLVLLPGMMCDARLFAGQVAALAPRPVLCPVPGGDSVDAMADAVLADAPPRFALGGLSMGGIVAMAVIAKAPDRVTRLALLDTNPLAEAPSVAARRGPQVDRALSGGLDTVMRDEMKPNYLADTPRRTEILDLCMDMALALGPQVFAAQSAALRDRPDRCDTLRAWHKPALVLCGEQDALCPPDRHRLMAGLIPGARLVIVAGAGHLPTLETPGAVNAALEDWLEEAA